MEATLIPVPIPKVRKTRKAKNTAPVFKIVTGKFVITFE